MTNLILIGGLAAAGKTTLGREIARKTRYAFFDKDTITQPLVEAALQLGCAPGGSDDRQSDFYLQQVRPLEYRSFLDVVIENVSLGVPSIAVAPFLREMISKDWLEDLQQQMPAATIHKLWIAPSRDLLFERVVGRGSTRDSHKLAHWDDYIVSCDKIKPYQTCITIAPQSEEDAMTLAERVLRSVNLVSA